MLIDALRGWVATWQPHQHQSRHRKLGQKWREVSLHGIEGGEKVGDDDEGEGDPAVQAVCGVVVVVAGGGGGSCGGGGGGGGYLQSIFGPYSCNERSEARQFGWLVRITNQLISTTFDHLSQGTFYCRGVKGSFANDNSNSMCSFKSGESEGHLLIITGTACALPTCGSSC